MEILLKKHAILFVHGWATDGRVWKEHVDYFSQKRTVINMVLPGHGSEKKWDSKTIEPAVLAIKEAIEGYEGKTIGIGWSLGAQSLIASAALNPGAFEKLVLVGATP
ncbi:MAG: alpha/beta fold hydrolase, partial [Deltaproteobacteria bacterium]|nr:alpha/beta fold hydrolase [Deltaproteobacteria bacterium]